MTERDRTTLSPTQSAFSTLSTAELIALYGPPIDLTNGFRGVAPEPHLCQDIQSQTVRPDISTYIPLSRRSSRSSLNYNLPITNLTSAPPTTTAPTTNTTAAVSPISSLLPSLNRQSIPASAFSSRHEDVIVIDDDDDDTTDTNVNINANSSRRSPLAQQSTQGRKRTREEFENDGGNNSNNNNSAHQTVDRLDENTTALSSQSLSNAADGTTSQRISSKAKRNAYIRISNPEQGSSTVTATSQPSTTSSADKSQSNQQEAVIPHRCRRRPVFKPFICSICWEPPKDMGTTSCGHIFCRKCILTALDAKAACPICRRKQKAHQLIFLELKLRVSPILV
ncbi:hypothetical protein BDF19DRAFT_435089 [Syncephalis fuscata]|nr:hypothetical protein BDF19DRAFT_435089 [Syncephalis fuscata]